MAHTDEQAYLDFASKISFFEFYEGIKEFKRPDFDAADFANEIRELESRKTWDEPSLAAYVRKYPRSFRILEQLFQNRRFTNTQLIHFVFNTQRLNDPDLDAAFSYAVYNLEHDSRLRELFDKRAEGVPSKFMPSLRDFEKTQLVAFFKMAVSDYIKQLSEPNKRGDRLIQERITGPEFNDFATRLAKYLLENLKLNEFLKGVDVKEYIKSKQIPVDNKTLHGNFATTKLRSVLIAHGFADADAIVTPSHIGVNDPSLKGLTKHFCTQRTVHDVVKPKEGKLKKFDFITIRNGAPRILIEANFYTTEGTKIGINEGEYRDLFNSIKGRKEYKFLWVTDGNYWLTPNGRERFLALSKVFDGVYNINTFERSLESS